LAPLITGLTAIYRTDAHRPGFIPITDPFSRERAGSSGRRRERSPRPRSRRGGNVITGQQNFSGAETAEVIVEAVGR
jgi:hypothetical protein